MDLASSDKLGITAYWDANSFYANYCPLFFLLNVYMEGDVSCFHFFRYSLQYKAVGFVLQSDDNIFFIHNL